nr:hypothetical protein [Tanacetum cinerariifolium]
MSITKEEQQALNDALVPREQCLRIGNSNYRLSTTFKPKEPTFQVPLDVLSLTLFYQAFLITTSVLAIYMYEFWATVTFQKHNIKFKMNKKCYSFDLETFRYMFQICLKVPGQKFVDPPFEEEIHPFMSDLGYPGNIKTFFEVKVEILPQPWRTFKTIINKCLSESEAYKTYYAFATGKAIPKPKYICQSVKEKTEQAPKASSGKRIKSAAKMKLAIGRRKTQLYSSQPSGSRAHAGTGVTPGVPDVPTYESNDEKISWKSSDDEDDDDETIVSKHKDDADQEDDDDQDNDDDQGDDDGQTDSDNDGDDFVHPKFSTHDEEDKEEDSLDPRVQTPSYVGSTDEDNDEEIQGVNVEGDELDDDETNEEDELYRDLNVNLEGRDIEMTDAQ